MAQDRPLKNPVSRPRVRRTKPSRPALTAGQRKELVAYFTERHRQLPIVQTTRTPRGQVLDWIDIASQVREGAVATPPPAPPVPAAKFRGRSTRLATFELQARGPRGPEGTVPVLRTDPKKLRFNKSLHDFLAKHGRLARTRYVDGHPIAQPEAGGPHDYATTSQLVTCYGGDGFISVFDPYTAHSDEFSLSQIAIAANGPNGVQTVEAGWQEFRDLYFDWIPHLFVYYTTNGYSQTGNYVGGYNQTVNGWIQYSNSVYPGAISNNVSTPGGTQWELFIKYQLYQGNWWLYVGDQWIGYFPATLFNDPGLSTQGTNIQFYGEIVDSASHPDATKTQMGTGYFAEAQWPYAAFQHNLRYQSDPNGSMSDYTGTSFVTDTKEYDIQTDIQSPTTWGSYFWFGGPGAP